MMMIIKTKQNKNNNNQSKFIHSFKTTKTGKKSILIDNQNQKKNIKIFRFFVKLLTINITNN